MARPDRKNSRSLTGEGAGPLAALEAAAPKDDTAALTARSLDGSLSAVSQLLIDGKPNPGYFARKFSDVDLMRYSIKALAYELARSLGELRLRREVSQPIYTMLPSKLCTQADIESDWYLFWAGEMKLPPIYHRKFWELCYIAQILWVNGLLSPGMTGLGFGCGQEPLPSLFVKNGVLVLATDLATEAAAARGWTGSGQHSQSRDMLRFPHICSDEALLDHIEFRHADMNDIPKDLAGRFDFCWSSCALEHLGSIEQGLAFIENSVKTLKPGGWAVHTTEFNLGDGETLDNWPTVLFQRPHLEALVARLRAAGHEVAPLDLSSGGAVLDGLIDIPPFPHSGGHMVTDLGMPAAHLKVSIDGFPCTSVGLAVRRSPLR